METFPPVSRLRPCDFDFIGTLASQVRGYTVPTPYVLWVLTRFHAGWSAVARAGQTRLGYLLAFPVNSSTVFVWQLACTEEGRHLHAPDALAAYLADMMAERKYKRIAFTSVPNTATERALRALARRIFKGPIHKRARLPTEASEGEWEYVLECFSS